MCALKSVPMLRAPLTSRFHVQWQTLLQCLDTCILTFWSVRLRQAWQILLVRNSSTRTTRPRRAQGQSAQHDHTACARATVARVAQVGQRKDHRSMPHTGMDPQLAATLGPLWRALVGPAAIQADGQGAARPGQHRQRRPWARPPPHRRLRQRRICTVHARPASRTCHKNPQLPSAQGSAPVS